MIELLTRRRSARIFEKRPLTPGEIDTLLTAALLAPSSRDLRPWEFIVVTNPASLKTLSMAKEHGSSFVNGAPCAIAVIADPERCDVWIEDASIASILIQLAAESMGLGSCWVQIRERFTKEGEPADAYVRRTLDIPDRYRVLSLIAVGHPARERKAHDVNKLPFHKIHRERYGG